jgi:hypothetical protein
VTRHFLYFAAAPAATAAPQLRGCAAALRHRALAGLAYFYLIFGGWPAAVRAEPALGTSTSTPAGPSARSSSALLAAWWWLWGGHRPASC